MDDNGQWPTQRDAVDWDDYDRRAHASPNDDAALALWLLDQGEEKRAREVIAHLAGIGRDRNDRQLALTL